MACTEEYDMSIFDLIMRSFNRHWVVTNWGPHVRHQQGTSCALHGSHSASRDYGA